MAERVLLLGTTGVDKKAVIDKLRDYAKSHHVFFVDSDFERDFIVVNNRKIHHYLRSKLETQQKWWKEGWGGEKSTGNKGFKSLLKKDENILLCLHGVLTGLLTGTRCPIHIESLQKFKPNKIITLIDDVYMNWHRTTKRAGELAYKGTPTLEQLFNARRQEILLSEVIAGQIESFSKHYVLATRHPTRSLFRLLFCPNVRTIYLSFPISGPRRLLKEKNDSSGIKEVNAFLKAANQFELEHDDVVCFYPLSIDEFPLRDAFNEYPKRSNDKSPPGDTMTFDLRKRWDTKEFWGEGILLINEKEIPLSIDLPIDQVKDAIGFLKADVRTRDYSLVLQSDCLVVFNPWFKNERATGVRNEIDLAQLNGIPVHIYQNKDHDENREAKKVIKGVSSPSMGDSVSADLIVFCETIKDLFASVLK